MVSFINSWAQGIIFAVIIATIIEIILPDGNNKKYIKTIVGIYILFVIIYPLISKLTNLDVNSIITNAEQEISAYENNNIELDTNAYIEDIYITNMEEDIKNTVNSMGYNLNSLTLDVETDDSNRYGEINSMNMKITKDENSTENNINNNIEKVEVKIVDNETNEENSSEITNEEIDELKENLSITYDIEKDKIYINE